MVFDKYKARRASLRELRSHNPRALELEYQKLSQPGPPLYEDIMAGWSAEEARTGDAQRRATGGDTSAGTGAGAGAVVAPPKTNARQRDLERRRLQEAQRSEGAQNVR